jgi:hypothetical protein
MDAGNKPQSPHQCKFETVDVPKLIKVLLSLTVSSDQ